MAHHFFKPTTVTTPLHIPFPSDPRLPKIARGQDFAVAPGDSCLHQAIAIAKKGEPVTMTARGEWLGDPVQQTWAYMAFRDEEENRVLFVMVGGEPGVDDPMCFRRIYPVGKVVGARDGPQV